MKRRDFFSAGTAIAAAGVAGTAVTAGRTGPAAAARPHTNPNIFDFGAKGDGATDDSWAFSRALEAAATEGLKVIVPGLTYAIAKPIKFSSKANVVQLWGLDCQGATLRSRIASNEDVISMRSNHTVRYFNLTGGLTIKGSGSERHGFHVSVPASGGKYFYNAAIDRLSVEGVGGDGLLFDGNVFECQITNSFFQDCKKNGATFAHNKGGICSSINLIGCYFNQNGRYGLEATTFDSKYGGASDIRVIGGYCRDNKGFGFRFNNGTIPGGAISQVGFENNCRSMKPGDPDGAHVYALVRMQMRDCTGYNQFGGATHLLRGWFSDLVQLDGCSQFAGGAMGSTGKSRLVQVNGSRSGHIAMHGCSGGVSVTSGTQCSWQAVNCTGPSPLGPLDIRSTIGTI